MIREGKKPSCCQGFARVPARWPSSPRWLEKAQPTLGVAPLEGRPTSQEGRKEERANRLVLNNHLAVQKHRSGFLRWVGETPVSGEGVRSFSSGNIACNETCKEH